MHLNNSKLKQSGWTANFRDLAWKVIAWFSIALLGFIGYSSQNIYHGAMDGKDAKIENVKQQQQLDSVCSRSAIQGVYIEVLRLQHEEFKKQSFEVNQDIKDIKNMIVDIYRNQKK